jgi:hypothetical protein
MRKPKNCCKTRIMGYQYEGYYVIQERLFFWSYTDLVCWVRDTGYRTEVYKTPPTEKLAELLKYG